MLIDYPKIIWQQRRLPTKTETDDWLWENRTFVVAGTAAFVSTASCFPLDSLKSRLQVKYYPPPSIFTCARAVLREEGLGGFFRGVWIPLFTISFVRTISFEIYYKTKSFLYSHDILRGTGLASTALAGMCGGATSGIIISCGSAPFELVKVQRQLDFLIAAQKGAPMSKYVPQSGFAAARNIFRNNGGPRGFYLGFPLHLTRDTFGTGFYFCFYDTMKRIISRASDEEGRFFGVPKPIVSFLNGSSAGIASWLVVYPVDLIKTRVQRDGLSGQRRTSSAWQIFTHLIRERPGDASANGNGSGYLRRFLRLYRGLGVSALRSFISHGLTWTLIETISERIQRRTGKAFNLLPT